MKRLLKRLFRICDREIGDCGCGGRMGICHLCRGRKPIRLCLRCDHWFCDACETRVVARATAAVVELVVGRKAKCCGPQIEVTPK